MSAAAIAALSDSLRTAIGMLTFPAAYESIFGLIPLPSLPMTTAAQRSGFCRISTASPPGMAAKSGMPEASKNALILPG
jgi:hypothetical protein